MQKLGTASLCSWMLAGWMLICGTSLGQDNETKKQPTQEELEKAFIEQMTGAVLVGSFTVDGKTNEAPKEEKYTIKKVTKEKDDIWLFYARIQYGKNDTTVPVPVYVKWAGDTPVVTLTDLSLPGMGKFTARVLFYRDHYAGYWQHDAVTGSMFGRIEKATAEKEAKEKKDSPDKN